MRSRTHTQSGLANNFSFHNQKIGSQTDLTATNEQRIKAEAAERRRMKELKASAEAEEAAERDRKGREEQEKKDRLKARAAMFESK